MFGCLRFPIFRAPQLISSLSARPRHIVTSFFPDITLPNCNYVEEIYTGIDRYPQRTALVDGLSGQSYTYTQVRQIVAQVGSGLLKRGFDKGQVLTIFCPNRPEFVFAAHGAIAAGITVCPLNSSYSALELARVLKNSETSVIVTDLARLPTVQEAAKSCPNLRSIFLLDVSHNECSQLTCNMFDDLVNDDGNALCKDFMSVDPHEDIALLPYSSGTSGLPKGVMLSHNNVVANMLQSDVIFDDKIGAESVIGILPFFHIYGLNVVLGHILRIGGTVVTLPTFDPQIYLKTIETHKATILHVVPPLMLFLVQHPLVKQTDFSSVHRILCGAAPLGGNIVEDVLNAMGAIPDLDVIQGYGLTETSPITHAVPRPALRPHGKSKFASVGVCVPSQECKVVNRETKQEVEAGEDGELLVRGPNVMRGYFNNPSATAECIDKDGWFSTGDIANYDEDGYFYISDRVKELIKYKGYQVAPAELEAELLSHPDIVDCAVIGRHDPAVGELPTAFVVSRSPQLDAAAVDRFLAARLSDHKQLRGGIIFTESVPRSPSGKLLRRLLRDQLNS